MCRTDKDQLNKLKNDGFNIENEGSQGSTVKLKNNRENETSKRNNADHNDNIVEVLRTNLNSAQGKYLEPVG
jgi:hypothetical protein